MRRVMVNSTPLIVLCSVGKLDLLRKLYKEIYIPQAVFDEVTEKPDSACQLLKESLDWIHVEKVHNDSDRKMYKAKLHDGEVEVMILAQEKKKADLVIIDDNAAKKTAKFLGLTVTGTIGVLLKAKREGYITELAPIIENMQNNGFYISVQLKKIVLEQAGEC
ncbi:DUF3368 domain-containing protein [Anaerolentibacter hominis]|uniref:DUF3368 domain-containing protein n=1 Tax=Anaerolentibacter hominis TaxID=3079009 RepID=UPI0031B893AE